MEVTERHPDVADVVGMQWGNTGTDPAPGAFVSGIDMCKWRYIIYTEGYNPQERPLTSGVSYSGRLKYNMLFFSYTRSAIVLDGILVASHRSGV